MDDTNPNPAATGYRRDMAFLASEAVRRGIVAMNEQVSHNLSRLDSSRFAFVILGVVEGAGRELIGEITAKFTTALRRGRVSRTTLEAGAFEGLEDYLRPAERWGDVDKAFPQARAEVYKRCFPEFAQRLRDLLASKLQDVLPEPKPSALARFVEAMNPNLAATLLGAALIGLAGVALRGWLH